MIDGLIFAQKGTTKKYFLLAPRSRAGLIMQALHDKIGGDWVICDSLMVPEGLLFDDGQIYKGFNPSIERYSDAILQLF